MAESAAARHPIRLDRLGEPVLAFAFTAAYLWVTYHWSAADFRAYAAGALTYPAGLDSFRYRIFMPLLGGGIARLTGAEPRTVYVVLTFLGVWAVLASFRRLLGNAMRPGRAALLAPFILYPMIWNYGLLNRLYYPFDMPAIAGVTLGCDALWRRDWRLFYPVLAFATLNRETAGVLILVYLFAVGDHLPRSARLMHLTAMTVLWAGLVVGVRVALGGAANLGRLDWWNSNVTTLRDMFTFHGEALKDWTKVALAFGGLTWVLPFVARRVDPFARRAAWAILPFFAATMLRAIVHEVRAYGELVPLVALPVACAAAVALDARARPRPASPAV